MPWKRVVPDETVKPGSPLCCARVVYGYRDYACGAKARVEHEGQHYCKRHDPVAKAARDAKRSAEWEAKQAKKRAEWKDQAEAPALRARVAALEAANARLADQLVRRVIDDLAELNECGLLEAFIEANSDLVARLRAALTPKEPQ